MARVRKPSTHSAAKGRRELQIRRQLLGSALFRQSRYSETSAIGAAKLLQSRPHQPPSPHRHHPESPSIPYNPVVTWRHLNSDIQHKILQHLPVEDLFTARLAGLDLNSSELHKAAGKLMRAECNSLRPLWHEWRKISRFKNREYRYNINPVEFSKLKKLTVCHCVLPALQNLWHLKDLKSLHVLFCGAFSPSMEQWNNALRLCSGLHELNLRLCAYQTFPTNVLKQKSLRRLDLSNARFTSLPDEIGRELPELQYVNLANCTSLNNTIPDSLLYRLETNAKRNMSRGRKRAVLLDLTGFSAEMKAKLVPEDVYPLLAASLVNPT